MYDVELKNVTKSYQGVVAVDNLSLGVAQGEFLTLLGPSGCGKTTTLNMVAGFLSPDSGEILLAGQAVNHLPPNRRDTAMVFQQYALFPHMTVAENVGFGLKMRKVGKDEAARRVARALDVVRLAGFGDRPVAQLSGGQQQRVALARAIVVEPTVLLMDEPLSNLDLKLREQLRLEIKNVQKVLGLTAIYVTHDQGEALVMSDRVAVMNNGVIEQLGAPSEIYERPRTPFVAAFIGTSNFLIGKWLENSEGELAIVRLRDGTSIRAVHSSGSRRSTGDEVTLSIRPEHLIVSASNGMAAQAEAANVLSGVVHEVTYLGSTLRYTIRLTSGEEVVAEEQNRDSKARVEPNQEVTIRTRIEDCLVLEPSVAVSEAPV